MAERPDEIEREESYRRDALAAMAAEFGPQQWEATIAVLAEGDPEAVDWTAPADREPDGLTYAEIGGALAAEDGTRRLGLSRSRVREIERCAMRKLRDLPIVQELFYGEPAAVTRARTSLHLIDASLARARGHA